ncbi:flagellar biosynthesis chaperone [Bacillus glycinifermentans]|uniref:Flagellar FliJ protein n=1 Tax=Bacillus glycinifermentans TaxID=1664069 RepID=A0A0J6EF10_9BACI|nr:flagellar export protein FliJ [Bacillus glycinifermentans]ATH91421.1 flagellar export protein FliJ [Bacillus glycinifermentans]KMM55995.1 flagellar biosynthesis chaperone [Bacillus glycinifermentans]KRT93848.1 flagellar biosynthesis chaperone [Bacillus glycinifermentans]MEC0485262.1 flagellar export protein FliJ [Bacillus glycinifermentans]MEC0495552.1 flagellar export protein FliJ [Bacillus glycinifermentans]
MAYSFKFQKLLELKENEKDQSFAEYQHSVSEFEKVAEKLYESMNKKETLEKNKEVKLQSGMSVQEMRHYQQFVTNLENTIHHYQKLVIMKRNEMNEKQHDLTEKNIELKKFEKMKEKQLEMFLIRNKANEMKEMDDISITQFMTHGN